MTPDRTKQVRELTHQKLHQTGQLLSLNELSRLLRLQAESCPPRYIREAIRHDRRIGRLSVPTGLFFGHDHVYYAHTNPFAEALANKVKEKLQQRDSNKHRNRRRSGGGDARPAARPASRSAADPIP